jgi:hypothetical protein
VQEEIWKLATKDAAHDRAASGRIAGDNTGIADCGGHECSAFPTVVRVIRRIDQRVLERAKERVFDECKLSDFYYSEASDMHLPSTFRIFRHAVAISSDVDNWTLECL